MDIPLNNYTMLSKAFKVFSLFIGELMSVSNPEMIDNMLCVFTKDCIYSLRTIQSLKIKKKKKVNKIMLNHDAVADTRLNFESYQPVLDKYITNCCSTKDVELADKLLLMTKYKQSITVDSNKVNMKGNINSTVNSSEDCYYAQKLNQLELDKKDYFKSLKSDFLQMSNCEKTQPVLTSPLSKSVVMISKEVQTNYKTIQVQNCIFNFSDNFMSYMDPYYSLFTAVYNKLPKEYQTLKQSQHLTEADTLDFLKSIDNTELVKKLVNNIIIWADRKRPYISIELAKFRI